MTRREALKAMQKADCELRDVAAGIRGLRSAGFTAEADRVERNVFPELIRRRNEADRTYRDMK